MVKRCRSCHHLTPGRSIVWFRNETTLLVLWQPPHPAGVYIDYKVSIDPPDAEISGTYVVKEGEPPGPAQAAFNGLIPGRAYNISVQTINERVLSDPTTAQDQTVPWRPNNVYFDPDSIGPLLDIPNDTQKIAIIKIIT